MKANEKSLRLVDVHGRPVDIYLCDLPEPYRSAEEMREALAWYEERVSQLANPKRSTDYVLAVIKELELDGGKRARALLSRMPNPAAQE